MYKPCTPNPKVFGFDNELEPADLGVPPISTTESPLLLPAPARTDLQKAHTRIRQRSFTENTTHKGADSQKADMQCGFHFDSAWAPLKIATIVGDAKAPAGMPGRL